MMYPQASRSGFSAAIARGRRFDPVAIATIAIGVVVMTALTMIF
ncbi:MAG TPA: hypothetical protein VMA30_23555 [Xanthobacteraceae bacterium]|nr:hypothetical protein [Xanthobacteraceae bacterium]